MFTLPISNRHSAECFGVSAGFQRRKRETSPDLSAIPTMPVVAIVKLSSTLGWTDDVKLTWNPNTKEKKPCVAGVGKTFQKIQISDIVNTYIIV